MKKMFFGSLLILIGISLCIPTYIYAAWNPWDYNGITGALGSLLGTGMIFPVVIGLVILLAGLIICYVEAFKKGEIK